MSTRFRSDLLSLLDERGFIFQHTDNELDTLFRTEKVSCYIGFDATASSLHAGSLVQIMLLRWLQKLGHRPIALLGGGTTRVGDPSGKDESRQLLTDSEISDNASGLRTCLEAFLTFGEEKALLVNNDDWLRDLRYIDFLRDYGRHTSVNRMLNMDSVRLRLEREQNLSFLEFNYMMLQAYDFVELFRRFGCRVQAGGSDQWGNIVGGIELGRKSVGARLFGMTTHLLQRSDGAKMGKTASGAVWLDAKRLSPYEYYQYWRNVPDADIGTMLGLFTELPMAEVRRLGALRDREANDAKKVLAFEATSIAHGEATAHEASEASRQVFELRAGSDAASGLEMPEERLDAGLGLLDALREAGLAASNAEARRKVGEGAVRINDEVTSDSKRILDPSLRDNQGRIKLSIGKKRHAFLKFGA